MKLKFTQLSLFFLLLCSYSSQASHLKAGDMTAEYIFGFKYRFTLTVYTERESVDNSKDKLDPEFAAISINGGQPVNYPRTSKTLLDEDTYENIFIFDINFPGSANYLVSYKVADRNAGIINIGQGMSEVPFYIETYVNTNAVVANANSLPKLQVPPIDKAAVGKIYYHNPGAYDSNGDSISFKLISPKQGANTSGISGDVPFYFTPDGLSINPYTGQVTWDKPKVKGLYNIAFIIEEFRDGIRIGFILRDMQIEVVETNNNPPVLKIPNDTCLISSTTLSGKVIATDPDGNKINLFAYSNLLSNFGATFQLNGSNPLNSPASATFNFSASCAHIRKEPYQVVFKAEDLPLFDTSLVDIKPLAIHIKGPAPEISSVQRGFNFIQINWLPYGCSNVANIEIYRKKCDSLTQTPPICTSDPALLGFEKIATIKASTLSFTDNENGQGLNQGTLYCYILKAAFSNGGESALSGQECTTTENDAPLPLQVSVLSTDSVNGKIALQWSKSTLPAIAFNDYVLKRGNGLNPSSFTEVKTFTSIIDTTYTDSLLNTHLAYSYTIENKGGSPSSKASTVDLQIKPGSGKAQLSWSYKVPWINAGNVQKIYKKTNSESTYSLLASVSGNDSTGNYLEENLSKKDTFCYYIETTARYCSYTTEQAILNRSQEVCILAIDSTPPCEPQLSINPVECKEVKLSRNLLYWQPVLSATCPDEEYYNLYFAENPEDSFKLLSSQQDSFYVHKDSASLAGCYLVKAVNIFGIESPASNIVCVDICTNYRLPNLLTPNGDNHNDLFQPFPDILNAREVDFKVYNRWGSLVFSYTGDPMLNWNGYDNGGNKLPDGTYFYHAKVQFQRRLKAKDEQKTLKGWLQIIN